MLCDALCIFLAFSALISSQYLYFYSSSCSYETAPYYDYATDTLSWTTQQTRNYLLCTHNCVAFSFKIIHLHGLLWSISSWL